jgi:hypothetical protein
MTKILVFGSNLAGKHSKGAALHARFHYGAEFGVGFGRTGNAYAIPTKGYRLEILPLSVVESYVKLFIMYANAHPELDFEMTEIGCGLARGNKTRDERRAEIAPLFKEAPNYVVMPEGWKPFL